ncbi:MAG TPA: CPBP family intramembrane glutamic endopeptidase [Levilinea sp.]|nr:CPBP family intramembrane glutamic endopeptidase [Levilinea sp.]
MNTTSKRPLWALPVIILGTSSLLYFGALAPDVLSTWLPFTLEVNPFVDGKLKYQIATFAIALVILAIVYALSPNNARRFYKLGNLGAPAEPVKWLGITSPDTWKTVGRNFAIIVSLATGIYIYFNVAQGQSLQPGNFRYLPFILLLAMMNAFTEEAITRLSVVTALDGVFPRPVIYLISAFIFGIPHFFGIPGGILGSLMAGFLGWLLAKSIAETEGMAWAWFIHFLLDVIIFGGLFLATL